MLQQTEPKRRRLPAPGLRLRTDIFTRQNRWQGRRLYRRHGLVTQLLEVIELFGGKGIQFGKGGHNDSLSG